MTNHPITPPQKLVEQWRNQAPEGMGSQIREMWIATQAAQWGADQELETCCEILAEKCFEGQANLLRGWRRPKPPSLKEQALVALHAIAVGANHMREQTQDFDTIRLALEALPND